VELFWEGTVEHMVLLCKPEGKSPLRRARRKLENNIKSELQVVGAVVERGWICFRGGTGGWRFRVRGGIFWFQKCEVILPLIQSILLASQEGLCSK
jgi:hypothetical protein